MSDGRDGASAQRGFSVLAARNHQIFQSRYKSNQSRAVPASRKSTNNTTFSAATDLFRARQCPILENVSKQHVDNKRPNSKDLFTFTDSKSGSQDRPSHEKDIDSLFKKYRFSSASKTKSSSLESRLIKQMSLKKSERTGISDESPDFVPDISSSFRSSFATPELSDSMFPKDIIKKLTTPPQDNKRPSSSKMTGEEDIHLAKLTKEKITSSTSLNMGSTRRQPSASSKPKVSPTLPRSIRNHSASFKNLAQPHTNSIPVQSVLNEVIRPTSALISASSPTLAYRSLMNWSGSSNNNNNSRNLSGTTNLSSINTNRCTSSLAGADLTLIRYYSSESRGSSEQPKMEEFWSNGDRITLVKKSIHHIPLISQEHGNRIKFLNLHDNNLQSLENIDAFSSLSVLDISNNRLENLDGIQSLRSLRVLNCSGNFLTSMSGYFKESRNLEVLDLHNNHITDIDLLGLISLKLLNLEGNCITFAGQFTDPTFLVDLNLKRNKIETVGEIGHLTNLKRFMLSHNQIANFSDCLEIFKLVNLLEFALEDNPVTLTHVNYRQYIVYGLKVLKFLDGKRISEEERRNAEREARKQIEKQKEQDRLVMAIRERNDRVVLIRQNWYKKLLNYETFTVFPSQATTTSTNSTTGKQPLKKVGDVGLTISQPSLESSVGDCHFEELRDSTLYLYGRVPIDLLLSYPADTVTAIHFLYMEMPNVERLIPKLKRFTKVTHFEFSFNLFFQLYQIRSLQGLLGSAKSVVIHPDHNPIVKGKMFRTFFLAKFGRNVTNSVTAATAVVNVANEDSGDVAIVCMPTVNKNFMTSFQGVEVKEEEVLKAEQIFKPTLDVMQEQWNLADQMTLQRYPNRKCDQFVQNGIKDMVRESKNMLRLIGVFQKGFNTA